MVKKIHKNSIIGQEGINLIERVVLSMGFLWNPTGGIEAGIDGWIEIRDSETGEVFNSIIQVQSKATINRFSAETSEGFEYLCDEKDINYWLQGNAPVILIVSRPNTDEAYWISIKDYFYDLAKRKERKVHFHKKRDRLDKSCSLSLLKLAVPQDTGIYFAPPPKRETLYSNLLDVSRFADRIYSAETEYRLPNAVWAQLREHGSNLSNIWILKDRRLYSFHNLAEQPWTKVCNADTIEQIDSTEWAFSLDADRRRTFVWLLNAALRDKLGALGIRYSKKCDCYYFKANKDLSLRRYTYRSLKSQTSRDVVIKYMNRNNPDKSCFRHSAFSGRFKLFDGIWYLEITPTYYFTLDGTLPMRFYENLLKGIKRLEKNQAVLGQVVMWMRLLSEPQDLFTPKHPYLGFGELQTFDIDIGIDDPSWLPSDQVLDEQSDVGAEVDLEADTHETEEPMGETNKHSLEQIPLFEL